MKKLVVTDLIDEKVIMQCEMAGVCESGLTWLREKPRTYANLRDESLGWYCWMANHINYAPTLKLLAKDASDYVRAGVARNAATPSPALELLAKDAHYTVRRTASNTLVKVEAARA
jgi:hypothetical protein